MARSDRGPFRRLASAAAFVLLCSLAGRSSALATGSAPAAGTAAASKPTAGKPGLTDAQRAKAKLRQHKPVMLVAGSGANDPRAGGKPLMSPSYEVTVSGNRTAAARATKKVAGVAPSTVSPGSAPAQAGATFQQRMARTTVTPPVMANGPKAVNTTPAKAAPVIQRKAISPALAAETAQPKSPPAGAKPAWHFRRVATASSTTSKVRGAVALPTVKAAATHAKAPTKAPTAVTVAVSKPAPKPLPVPIAPRPAAPAVKVAAPLARPEARAVKVASAQSPKFKSVQAGSSTAPATLKTTVKTTAATAPKPTTKPKSATTVATLAAPSVPVAKLTIAQKTKVTATAKRPAKSLTTSVSNLGARFMEQREQYVYNSLNRRDPYASLVSGSFEGEVGTPLLDVSSMKLVGIVWGASDKFALVEDGHGHGFVLRVGDPVLNGYIAGLTKEELIVKQSSYGDTQTVTIQLQRKEGASNAQ